MACLVNFDSCWSTAFAKVARRSHCEAKKETVRRHNLIECGWYVRSDVTLNFAIDRSMPLFSRCFVPFSIRSYCQVLPVTRTGALSCFCRSSALDQAGG